VWIYESRPHPAARLAQAGEQGADVMLRLGLPISRHESPVVLTVPGRKSGKPRSTPITPMVVDGERYVVNGYPGAVPTGVDLMKRAGVLTSGTPDELEGLAGRLPVFRIDSIT
jgi:F420H(2)-dependent quinone reductase